MTFVLTAIVVCILVGYFAFSVLKWIVIVPFGFAVVLLVLFIIAAVITVKTLHRRWDDFWSRQRK